MLSAGKCGRGKIQLWSPLHCYSLAWCGDGLGGHGLVLIQKTNLVPVPHQVPGKEGFGRSTLLGSSHIVAPSGTGAVWSHQLLLATRCLYFAPGVIVSWEAVC